MTCCWVLNYGSALSILYGRLDKYLCLFTSLLLFLVNCCAVCYAKSGEQNEATYYIV